MNTEQIAALETQLKQGLVTTITLAPYNETQQAITLMIIPQRVQHLTGFKVYTTEGKYTGHNGIVGSTPSRDMWRLMHIAS